MSKVYLPSPSEGKAESWGCAFRGDNCPWWDSISPEDPCSGLGHVVTLQWPGGGVDDSPGAAAMQH